MIESLPEHEVMTLPVRPFGRIARSVAGYGVATALMLVSPLLVFAPAALFHCGLRNGRRATWVAAVIAAALTGAYFAQVAHASGAGVPAQMAWTSCAAIMLAVALPAMLVLPLVQRGAKFGDIVTIAIIASAAGLGATELVMRSFAGFSPYTLQVAQAHDTAGKIVEMYRGANAGSDVLRWMQRWMDYAVGVLPAMILIDMVLVFVLSLMMFGRLTAWRALRRNGTLPATANAYLFRTFSLPDWLLFAFVFGGLTPLTSGLLQKAAANVLAIVVFLYLLQGLALYRALLIRAGAGLVGGLFAFALLIMLSMTGIGLLLLFVAGLFDPFFDFRHLKRKDDSHEGHTD